MQESDFRLPAQDGTPVFVRSFLPEQEPRAVVQISHGMAEHSARYARLAAELCKHGYAVYAADHRGHGKTAPSSEELGFFAERRGWQKVVGDQISLLEEIKSRHHGVPVFLMGHSMGSFIARGAAWRRGEMLAGLILSGTSHDHPIAHRITRLVATAERARLGRRGKSSLIHKLSFESFNAKFRNPRTDSDWLSRDAAEVDKYRADPLCGFQCSAQLWRELLRGLGEICKPENLGRMPKTLPVFVMAGELDPVNNGLAGIRKLRTALEAAKMESVTVRIYQGARHEIFNETNRDEVTRDLVTWLDQQLA